MMGFSSGISIADTGLGISDNDQQALFTPFQTFGERRPSLQSSGIGLALVKKLCLVLNMDITCKSKLGMSSTFTVTF
jgi:signal transduction histidine kinase